ncbi:hypothetical protein M0811_04649 [Anaeramoeba ignava]|uniref:Uncharacterized protein n=1 Tax=Anaeramoeba ignava TaxID=1746090 RepID=A0A9Q0RFI4_ANAIG|nr:hypothetical protein M0811_04649 [Anaeramoeba ignava]
MMKKEIEENKPEFIERLLRIVSPFNSKAETLNTILIQILGLYEALDSCYTIRAEDHYHYVTRNELYLNLNNLINRIPILLILKMKRITAIKFGMWKQRLDVGNQDTKYDENLAQQIEIDNKKKEENQNRINFNLNFDNIRNIF